MKKNVLKSATFLALAAAFISGTNNFLAKIAVTAVKDPVLFTTIKNTIVAVLLIGVILAFRRLSEIKALNRKQWVKLGVIGVIGGALPFALFFTGLSMTSAISGSLIHKTLFLWVGLLAWPFLKERLTLLQGVGVALLFASNFFVGGFTGFSFNTGELMILAATLLWAVENIIAKKALVDISSLTLASARMVIGSSLLIIFLASQGRMAPIADVGAVAWGWTMLSSILLFGYVIAWYSALKIAPATYVASILVSATLVTNVLSALFVTHTMTALQLKGGAYVLTGLFLLIFFAKKTYHKNVSSQVAAHVTG